MIRAALESRLRRLWRTPGQGAGLLGAALTPIEAVFASGVALRNGAYDRGLRAVESVPVPVISVGNLAVGGTGKTPFAAWIAARLIESGARPAIVSRGYGSDEAKLHRAWNPDVRVVVDPRRGRGVATALREGTDVAVLDDGFQHRALRRDLDLVLLAAEHPYPFRLLPRGPYREPERALARADGWVVTRRTASLDEAHARAASIAAANDQGPGGGRKGFVHARLEPVGWHDLAGMAVPTPTGQVLAVSSVAGPEEFHRLLERGSPELRIDQFVFPDHHEYSGSELTAIARRAGTRTVVTTEKDSVKLKVLGGLGVDVRVLRLSVEIEEGEAWLNEALAQAVHAGGTVDSSSGGESNP